MQWHTIQRNGVACNGIHIATVDNGITTTISTATAEITTENAWSALALLALGYDITNQAWHT